MSTRSVVARPTVDSWEGRYIHFDGYPTGVGFELWCIVKNEGVLKAREVLINDNSGWSSLNSNSYVELSTFGNNKCLVEGFGIAYTDTDVSEPFISPNSEESLFYLDFGYIIQDDGIAVMAMTSKGYDVWGVVKYDMSVNDAYDAFEKINGGNNE